MKRRTVSSAKAPRLVTSRRSPTRLGALFLLSACLSPLHGALAEGAPHASYASVGARTTVPFGWADFCRRYEGECDDGPLPPQDLELTPKAAQEVERINKWVNARIQAITDMDHWGVIDQWDYPTDGKGDCEDYALLKRKLLIERGYPRQALLMTVVKDVHDVGHAILTIKSDVGEFVLDNLNNDMKPWNQTGYRFVKRQSQSNQNVWVQIGEPTAAPEYVSH